MVNDRKTRSDAKLKLLSPTDRAEVAGWLEQHSQAETRRLIAEKHGFEVAASTLTEFYQWFHLSSRIEETASFVDRAREDLKALPGLDLNDDQLARIGQALFEMQAVKERDGKLFVALRKQRLTADAQRLEREKFEAMQRREEEARKTVGDEALTAEEKARRIKEIFGRA